MSESQPISKDRQDAIRLMQICGWEWKRDGMQHKFTQPDTGGWYDVQTISHKNLSLRWALCVCGDMELARRISEVKQAWLREVMPPQEGK